MVGIIDYGVGNLFSLQSSFAAIGREAVVSGDPEVLRKADHILLPGVGASVVAAGVSGAVSSGVLLSQAARGRRQAATSRAARARRVGDFMGVLLSHSEMLARAVRRRSSVSVR